MSNRPPFDPIKATFWLIAGIMIVQSLIVLAAAVSCLIYSKEIVLDNNLICDPKDRMMQLLQNMLSAALALLAGFVKGPPSPPPKE